MDIKVIVDGVEKEVCGSIHAYLQERFRNPYDVRKGDIYYFVDNDLTVGSCTYDPDGPKFHVDRNVIGNCCRDYDIVQQTALHMQLNMRLLKYSREVSNATGGRWTVSYNNYKHECEVGVNDGTSETFPVYFQCETDAENAVRDVVIPFIKTNPDFVW